MQAETRELAGRFDQRNGTTLHSETLRAWCALEPLTNQPLELGLRIKPLPVPPIAAAPATPVPEEFSALLAEAREALHSGRPEAHRLWQAVAQRAGEADLDDLLRAELADREAFVLIPSKRWAEAEELLRRSAELFDSAGEPGRAVARRSRAAWCGFQAEPGPAEPSWGELDRLAAQADELLAAQGIEGEDYCIVRHSRTASALSALSRSVPSEAPRPQRQDPSAQNSSAQDQDARDDQDGDVFAGGDAPARERFDRELELFYQASIRLGVPQRAAVARAIGARAAEADDRVEDALALAEEAVALGESTGRPWILPDFLIQAGHLLNRLKRLEEAAERLHRALALAAEFPTPEMSVGGLLMELAWNRLNADDPAAAAGHLTAAAARFDREERGQLRLDLGRALMRTGESKEAAEVFVGLADFIRDWPEQAIRTMVDCELAGALFTAGLLDQARAAAERTRQSHAQAPNVAAMCAMLRRAASGVMEAADSDGAEEALGYLAEADAVTAAAEELAGVFQRWPETAQSADLRTQILGALGRDEEALAATVAASVAWERGGSHTVDEWAESVRIAAVLEGHRLGRREQAVARIAPAVERCRLAGRDRAVKILTQLADNLREG
jgi:tetratricopeptide (TPR) repeat protein